MTDRLPPAPGDDLDELASAYLDGEATPQEAARVQADPALSARVAELRAVARAVAEPVASPDADVRDVAIGRALAAATTVDLAAERRRRGRTGLWVASVAAAVLVALLAVPLLVRNLSGGGDDTAVGSADQNAPAAERGTTADVEEDAGAGAGTTVPEAAARRPFLGTFADEQSLVAAVNTPEFAPTDGGVSPLAAGAPCATPDSAGEPVEVYDATLDGEPVTVVVLADPYGDRRVLVLDSRCTTVIDTAG